MLEKSTYDSWASRIRLFVKGKKHDDCDVQAKNIILYGLSPDVYALVIHQDTTKDILDRVKMLMKGLELSFQERECRLNNLFDKFAHVLGEALYEYYWRFSQLQGEDLIECINKAMAFLSNVASRFPPSKNQLRTSSNPRNQSTIQDGRVIIQQVQGRQHQSYAGTGNRGIATSSKGNVAVGPSRVVKCYNYQGEVHMARQCTQPKRPRNVAWFKENLMLAEDQEVDCDDLSLAKVVLMANLSSCDLEVLSEVPYSDSYPNDMINQNVQEMQYSEQTHVHDFEDNEIHNCSNIIPYSQYMQESQDAVIQDTSPSAPNDLLVISLVEQITDHVAYLDKEIRQIKWMMLDSIDNGLLVYQTIKENGQTKPKKFFKLTKVQQLQDDCDVQAKNIILYGLSPDVYALVIHQDTTKDILDRVKMLMKGLELSFQERECRLNNLFDKFAHVLGEALYEYYWRFSQLINDMHTIGMTIQQVQVNTKFLNALLSK
nr:hypothetical protein [Tanacetum cinerariifolium]